MENRTARRIVISKNTKIKNLEEEYLGSWEVLVIIPAVIHKDIDSSTVRLMLEQLPSYLLFTYQSKKKTSDCILYYSTIIYK